MLRVLHLAARGLGSPIRAARRRPLTAALVTTLGLVAAGLGGWWYARDQWRRAQAAMAADNPAEARDRLDVCLRVWPKSPDVHLLAARAARLTGDYQSTEAHLNECLRLNGGATEAVQIEFLLLRAQTGDVDAVFAPLIDVVEKGHPDAPLILEALARAFIHQLRYKIAYGCLSRWIDLRPDAARPYMLRGFVLERLDQHKAAAQDYHKALELDPDLVPARLRVAEMLLEDKQAPEALPHLERLYRQHPDKPEVQARLGICRHLQGRSAEARQLMEAAVAHLPNDPALLVALAQLDNQEGRGAEAEKWLRRVLANDPSDNEALYTLATALDLQGRREESAAVLKEYERYKALVERSNRLLREVPDSKTAGADDYAELGDILLQVGQDRRGVYWLERALEKDPNHQRAHRALAAHYDKKGDSDRAAAHRARLRDPAPPARQP